MSIYNALGAAARGGKVVACFATTDNLRYAQQQCVDYLNGLGDEAPNNMRWRGEIRFTDTCGSIRFIIPDHKNTRGHYDVEWLAMDELPDDITTRLIAENSKTRLRRKECPEE